MTQRPTTFTAGFLQIDVRPGEIKKNLTQVESGLHELLSGSEIKHPGIIVLPEMWATGFSYNRLTELADRTTDVLEDLKQFSRKYNIILAGSLPEKDGKCVFNTLFITGAEGVIGAYRKQQLFVPMQEDENLCPGDNPHPIETDLGLLAGLVCYDLRFPELAKSQVSAGANLLIISAQWPLARKDHWRTLILARAIENQVFVIACNRCGADIVAGGTTYAGHSMIVAPDGTNLSEAGEEPTGASVHIDTADVESTRKRFNTVSPSPYRFHDKDKIIDLGSLADIVKQYKYLGKKIVFTNGCFDILHAGHVTYLETARKQGDCLVVGLNSDKSVRSIKGPDRPVNSQTERARILAALGCVDHVALFDQDTPHKMITTLMPDVLAKGADWSEDEIVGAKEVKENGGKVALIPFVGENSTTSIIDKIRKT